MSPYWSRRLVIFVLSVAGLAATVFREPLYALCISVLGREGSSHGLFMPFISAYLLWLTLDKIKKLKPQAALMPGIMLVAGGLLLLYFSRHSEVFFFSALSFLPVVCGLTLAVFGRDVFREVAFPLILLAAMIPLPPALSIQLAEWMRQMTTWGSVTLTQAFGISLFREGYDVYLPSIRLRVDYGCSGVRYLLSYLVFGTAYAFLFKKSTKTRVLTVLAALPLSVAASVTRLSTIFIAVYYFGPYFSEHRPHVVLSWSVFAIFLVGAIAADQYLSRVRGQKRAESFFQTNPDNPGISVRQRQL